MAPHSYFDTIRPDEVAECWDGVDKTPGLYNALWACVADYKAPSPEESEEPCIGLDTVADFWDRFSPDQQEALNTLAEAEDARPRQHHGRDLPVPACRYYSYKV